MNGSVYDTISGEKGGGGGTVCISKRLRTWDSGSSFLESSGKRDRLIKIT